MARFLILNITGLAILIAGWQQGAVAILFIDAPYHATWMVASLLPIGLYLTARGSWRDADAVSDWMVRLGLFGTVAGLAVAFYGVSGEVNVSLRDLGGATALHTTIVGLAGSLWLDLNERLLNR